jgi:hypothetical protein
MESSLVGLPISRMNEVYHPTIAPEKMHEPPVVTSIAL